ncbi:MAG: hypothetical protein ACOYJA_01000 [Christensenellales bacterium]|jgi:cytoskeletal protein CcmA (bactofilin family)
MSTEQISGFGSVHTGEYDSIIVDGVGKVKGPVIAKRVAASGLFKVKGRLVAGEMKVDGFTRAFRNIRADALTVSGLLKLRRADLEAETLNCQGLLISNGEINADQVAIDGACSIATLLGDKITIGHDENAEHMPRLIVNGKPVGSGTMRLLSAFGWLYLGRSIPKDRSLVDTLECTELTARRLVSKRVRANRVTLRDNCHIGKLYCEGPIDMDRTCVVDEIIASQPQITHQQQEEDAMANATLVKILDGYKGGRIDADEAERMIASLRGGPLAAPADTTPEAPWEEDGKLRIVAFLGRKLLKRGQPELQQLQVTYQGPALAVECWGNLNCNDVDGDAKAGGNLTCHDIQGNANAGGKIACNDVDGNVSAGGSVQCRSVNGNIAAGGGVTTG